MDENENSDLEERVSKLETEVDAIQGESEAGSLSLDDVREQIKTVQSRQSDLEDSLDSLYNRLRQDEENIPHIETVEQFYESLHRLDQNISEIEGSVDTLKDELETN
jgi:chromosome segregation ATPase